jgi:hypothetical protein
VGLTGKLKGIVGRGTRGVRVHLLIRGRMGPAWHDIDRTVRVPRGTTLELFIEHCRTKGIPLQEALDASPHLRHTLMWNGERSPLAEHGQRVLEDGDELYLLAPIAGG